MTLRRRRSGRRDRRPTVPRSTPGGRVGGARRPRPGDRRRAAIPIPRDKVVVAQRGSSRCASSGAVPGTAGARGPTGTGCRGSGIGAVASHWLATARSRSQRPRKSGSSSSDSASAEALDRLGDLSATATSGGRSPRPALGRRGRARHLSGPVPVIGGQGRGRVLQQPGHRPPVLGPGVGAERGRPTGRRVPAARRCGRTGGGRSPRRARRRAAPRGGSAAPGGSGRWPRGRCCS